MLKSNLENNLNQILGIGPRAPGSWKELEAAEFINEQFQNYGYDSEIKMFSSGSHNATNASLYVEDKEFEILPSQFSPEGKVRGELLYLGDCSDPFGLKKQSKGKIGIVFASENFENRLKFLLDYEAAGMAALIVISNRQDNIETKNIRFDQIKRMPITACGWGTGNELVTLEGENAELTVNWCEKPRDNESQNVVAVLPGTGPYWMAVSGHHDTAPYAPGAMDNGGGTCLLMETAKEFAGKQFPVTIYFVSTGSEENGGMDCTGAGAKAFYRDMKDQIENCIGHVEIDDIGNVLGIPEVFYRGNKKFTDLLLDDNIRGKYKVTKKDFYSCDNGAPSKLGLPFIWFTDAISIPRVWYHTPDDTKDKMCIDKLAMHFDYIRETVERLAQSQPFYPYFRQDDLLIRPARYEDKDAVKEITKLAFEPVTVTKMQEKYFGLELGDTPWHVYKNRDVDYIFEHRLDQVVVCEKNNEIVGYATAIYNHEKMIAEIGNNAVHPDYQGQGIGKAMQREIARRMLEDGFERFEVQTLSCDIAAQKVYEKLGYERITENIIYLKEKN